MTIPLICVLSLSLVTDMICKDRLRSKNKANVTTNVAVLMVMAAIFPYFYFDRLDWTIIFIGLIFAVAMYVCKLYLTIWSYGNGGVKEVKEVKSEIEEVIEDTASDDVLE